LADGDGTVAEPPTPGVAWAGTAAVPAAGAAGRAGAGAGAAAWLPVTETERPAAVRSTSPGEDAVTDGTVPAVVRLSPPWAGRWTGSLVIPGHTTLVPLGPSDALTASLVTALTAGECRLASADAAAGGNAMVSVTPVGWMGLPVFAVAGTLAVTPTVTGYGPEGNRHR